MKIYMACACYWPDPHDLDRDELIDISLSAGVVYTSLEAAKAGIQAEFDTEWTEFADRASVEEGLYTLEAPMLEWKEEQGMKSRYFSAEYGDDNDNGPLEAYYRITEIEVQDE